MQQVRAVHVAMVRRKDDDSAFGETRGIELGKHRGNIAIDVAQAIQVVVVPPAPAWFFIGNFTHQRIM